MTATRSRRTATTLAAAGALAVALPVTAAHAAAPTVVTGGTTTLRPSGPAYRALDRAGVEIGALGDARATGGRIALPVAKGSFGRVTTLAHAPTDGLALERADDTVRLTDLRIRLGRSSRVTGRVDGGSSTTLFVLKASGLTRKGTALRASRSKVTWRLSARAARTLRKALGVRGLRAGTFATSTLSATLLAPGAPAAPGAPPSPGAPAVPGTPSGISSRVVAGSAGWGIRASFRRYVAGGGSIATSDGATVAPDGTFGFGTPSGTVDRATGALDIGFRGTVYFENHGQGDGAALRVWVRNPRVVSNGTNATLYTDLSSKDLSTGTIKEYPGVAFATLDLTKGSRTTTDGAVTWTAVPATLTAAGAEGFAGYYQAGAELDPLSFSVATG